MICSQSEDLATMQAAPALLTSVPPTIGSAGRTARRMQVASKATPNSSNKWQQEDANGTEDHRGAEHDLDDEDGDYDDEEDEESEDEEAEREARLELMRMSRRRFKKTGMTSYEKWISKNAMGRKMARPRRLSEETNRFPASAQLTPSDKTKPTIDTADPSTTTASSSNTNDNGSGDESQSPCNSPPCSSGSSLSMALKQVLDDRNIKALSIYDTFAEPIVQPKSYVVEKNPLGKYYVRSMDETELKKILDKEKSPTSKPLTTPSEQTTSEGESGHASGPENRPRQSFQYFGSIGVTKNKRFGKSKDKEKNSLRPSELSPFRSSLFSKNRDRHAGSVAMLGRADSIPIMVDSGSTSDHKRRNANSAPSSLWAVGDYSRSGDDKLANCPSRARGQSLSPPTVHNKGNSSELMGDAWRMERPSLPVNLTSGGAPSADGKSMLSCSPANPQAMGSRRDDADDVEISSAFKNVRDVDFMPGNERVKRINDGSLQFSGTDSTRVVEFLGGFKSGKGGRLGGSNGMVSRVKSARRKTTHPNSSESDLQRRLRDARNRIPLDLLGDPPAKGAETKRVKINPTPETFEFEVVSSEEDSDQEEYEEYDEEEDGYVEDED